MNTTLHYALHIDDLRLSKGLTVHELCDGICDDSTYRRYKTGKKDIPIYKIKMFCDKLDLSLDEFLSNTMSKTSIEYKKIYNLYYAMQKKEWEIIGDFIDKNQNIALFYPSNKTLYSFITNTYLYQIKKISEDEYLQKLINLLPGSLNTASFNDVIILEKISDIEVNHHIVTHLNILNELLLNPKKLYLIKNNEHVISNLYANVSIFYSRLKLFHESYAIAEKGISFSLKHNQYKALPRLYYLLAYTLFNLGKQVSAFKELTYMFAHIFSTKKKDQLDYFLKLVNEEFGQDIYDQMENYLSLLDVSYKNKKEV